MTQDRSDAFTVTFDPSDPTQASVRHVFEPLDTGEYDHRHERYDADAGEWHEVGGQTVACVHVETPDE